MNKEFQKYLDRCHLTKYFVDDGRGRYTITGNIRHLLNNMHQIEEGFISHNNSPNGVRLDNGYFCSHTEYRIYMDRFYLYKEVIHHITTNPASGLLYITHPSIYIQKLARYMVLK